MSAADAPATAALEERIVDFALGVRFDDLPTTALNGARVRLLDSIGVAMAAFLAPPSRMARRLAQPVAAGSAARVWGTAIRTSPEMAAFASGVMVRYLDLNDAWRTRDAHHPSDYIPGVLAVAEATGANGRAFVEALAVAYEIMCRFTDAVPFNTAGWDQPVTGAIGTAMAAGRLFGLEREAMGHALSLAVIPNLATYQTRAGELSMWKGCAGPNGARNGVFAARLAAEGMTGPVDPFDGIFGVWNQTLDGTACDLELPDGAADWQWGIWQTNIKTHAVRDSCQLPIFTALDLRRSLSGRPVEALMIETYRSAWEGAVKDRELWAPKTRETADHSMLFSVACALLDGRVTPDSFEDERFRDADVLDLIGRTEVVVRDDYTAETPGRRNCRILARLTGGETVEAHRIVTLEEIARGMSDADLEAKFRETSRRAFTPEQQDGILATVGELEELAEVAVVLDAMEL